MYYYAFDKWHVRHTMYILLFKKPLKTPSYKFTDCQKEIDLCIHSFRYFERSRDARCENCIILDIRNTDHGTR